MSLYPDYIKERLGNEILETDKGFAIYRFTDEKTVYIVDIYVKPEHRRHGVASDIADHIEELARGRGCTSMLGSVVASANGSTDSIRVLLAYGMKVISSGQDFILFRKEI